MTATRARTYDTDLVDVDAKALTARIVLPMLSMLEMLPTTSELLLVDADFETFGARVREVNRAAIVGDLLAAPTSTGGKVKVKKSTIPPRRTS